MACAQDWTYQFKQHVSPVADQYWVVLQGFDQSVYGCMNDTPFLAVPIFCDPDTSTDVTDAVLANSMLRCVIQVACRQIHCAVIMLACIL